MKNVSLVCLLLCALLLLGGCATVNSNGTRLITGGDYVLQSGERFDGNLLVLGGNSTLQQGSTVNGNLSVIGGNTNANGAINGSIAVIGGNVNLGSSAVVRGDVNISGGNVSRAPGAQIIGSMTETTPFEGLVFSPVFTITPLMQAGWLLLRSLLEAALAAVIVLIWQEPVKRTRLAMVEHPFATGLVGLVVMLLAPILLVLFAITVIGIPVTIILVAALIVALVFGWIALGVEVGERLARALKVNWQPALTAAVGTFLLVVLIGAIDLIPIVGWLATSLVSMLALGAVVLSRFGTHTYAPPSNVVTPPAMPQGRAA